MQSQSFNSQFAIRNTYLNILLISFPLWNRTHIYPFNWWNIFVPAGPGPNGLPAHPFILALASILPLLVIRLSISKSIHMLFSDSYLTVEVSGLMSEFVYLSLDMHRHRLSLRLQTESRPLPLFRRHGQELQQIPSCTNDNNMQLDRELLQAAPGHLL